MIELNRLARLLGIAAVAALSACGSDDGGGKPRLPLAVFTAFPGELLPIVEGASVDATETVAGRLVRSGTIGGVPVVMTMTGIGLQNAAETSAAVLDRFDVAGVVFSGVAGSPHRIGDVTVAQAWEFLEGSTYPVDQDWLEIAGRLAAAGSVTFDRCTERPSSPTDPPVCVPHEPAIFVGGVGQSSDPYAGYHPICLLNGGDVFGCDIDLPPAGASGAGGGDEEPIAVDQETAAVAREAAMRGLPFIGFRAVSDGMGDPLMLPGFPQQFFTYYRLAARNAAKAVIAFLEEMK